MEDDHEYEDLFNGLGSHWLAESGSTKTDWVCYQGPELGMQFATPGFNPSYLTPEQLRDELETALAGRPWNVDLIETFTWYGAGCAGMGPKMAMAQVLMQRFENAGVTVQHDLIAAARATLGREPGLVAILGTGSHCCSFDGHFIEQEAVSLGYMLGDEGGGADLGRRLLRLYFYGQLPAEESSYLSQTLALTRDAAIERLYRRPWPNRWLASLAPHVAARPALRELVAAPALRSFVDTHLLPLASQNKHSEFAAVGSISAQFEPELQAALAGRLHLAQTLASPLPQLVEYHKQHGFMP